LTNSRLEDIRVAAGFGLGSTNLDNELIMEAFIMGAGMGCGMSCFFLQLDPSTVADLSVFCLKQVSEITGMEVQEGL
jgi:hypothetical protein